MLTRLRLNQLILILFFCFQSLQAQKPIIPYRTHTPPVIDGQLDEPFWQKTQSITNFKTCDPDFGLDMAQKTTAYIVYDSENLYFGFLCEDTEPDKIKAALSVRDNVDTDDFICIYLDTFNDRQALSAFYVNPLGIQGDSRFFAGTEDFNIDMVWYSASRIHKTGYSVEARIPLESIRFTQSDSVRMGIVLGRKISRFSALGTFPPMDPDKGLNWLTQTWPVDFGKLKHRRILELLPAFTYGQNHERVEDKFEAGDTERDFSFTTKYGITRDLILDGTYNPDFSQVEADAGQVDVNLRYDLYFPEKRPFFLEGSENFRIAGTTASERDPLQSIVHTRTIVDPIVGGKLTGKIGTKGTISMLYAQDELDQNDSGEDFAHYAFLRYKNALYEDSFIGGIYAGKDMGSSYNRVFGVDAQVRITQASQLHYHALLSKTHVENQPAEDMAHGFGLKYNYSTRDLDFAFSMKDLSENFNAEMGYITRNGILQFTGLIKPKLYPKSEAINRIDIELFSAQTKDKYSDLWETFNHLSAGYFLWGTSILQVKYFYSTEIFTGERFKTGGFYVYGTSQLSKQVFIGALYRNSDAIYYDADPYQGHSNYLSAKIVYQPSDKVETMISFTDYDFYRKSDSEKIYNYLIGRCKLSYQFNKYMFLRGIVEYNDYRKELLTDFLASFTYIPGTVIHLGHGSIYQKTKWDVDRFVDSRQFHESKRGLFFKMSYLWQI